MMTKIHSYKPLLFTTTMRNPERLKLFLAVLEGYNGKILDNKLAEKIAGDIIERGLYRPSNLSSSVKIKLAEGKLLTHKERGKVLRDNPQNHKEAGFDRGWPSRFDTWFKMSKELGFVFYRLGENISISNAGRMLIDTEHPEFEQQSFLNAFVKYQRNNPFRRVLNENVPLVLLLQVIVNLNNDEEFNGAGIAKHELPLLIYWKDGDAESLYQRIKKLRQDHGFSPSAEVVVDICLNEIMGGKDVVRSPKSILSDYLDDFIRKMRLTGLVSLRGGGRFIDINQYERERIEYVLNTYSSYEKYASEEEYFEYVSSIDENLMSFSPKFSSAIEKEKSVKKWVDIYSWKIIKDEMLILSKKHLSKHETLKYLSQPVRLEFLAALAVKSKFPEVKVIPNYPIDDEGIPTSTAHGSGDIGDIECFEGRNGILIEVTMSEGRIQTVMEIWPIDRHLEKFEGKSENSICYFVAPSIFRDSERQIAFVEEKYQRFIIPKKIKDFLDYLENSNSLYSINH